jgi:hypothetical protein
MTDHNPSWTGQGQYELTQIFRHPASGESRQILDTGSFVRTQQALPDQTTLILDEFPDMAGASCCFLRMPAGTARTAKFLVQGNYQAQSCQSGGWLLKPADAEQASYWIPQSPVSRSFDSRARILAEEPAAITGFSASPTELVVEITVPDDRHVDITVWQFLPEAASIQSELEQPLVLETQPVYLWNSQTGYRILADVYLYLVHGHVYTDRFIWPRMWKICSELDAYSLYVTLEGLELATGKAIYSLLKRQVLFSVITRQDEDGGWYHGEWTDRMESHYRFHNGALLLLEAGLEEWPEAVIRDSLERGASFISRQKDETELGTWFLHDSLEDSPELMDELSRQTGSRWEPNRIFGKSPTNKLILNTHLDTIVALERYREVTGDNRYKGLVDSARAATKAVLALRPAEQLYRLAYRAIGLTLLPATEAERLPALPRATKRLTWMYLTPQLYRLKKIYPRFVMPGGLIERHLSMPHCDFNYPAVNVMDLARYWRCFPDEDLAEIMNNAINAVTGSSIMKYWAEVKTGNRQQFAVVVWVEAMYNMCTLSDDPVYRRYLAEAILCAEDAGLGLPPALLGADHEAVQKTHRIPCPSPTDPGLRVINLSCGGRMEVLVINSSPADISLQWEKSPQYPLAWSTAHNHPLMAPDDGTAISVPSRDWLLGKGN